MTQFISLQEAETAIQSRIDRLKKMREDTSRKMDKFAEDLYYGLMFQVQVDSINDGFNGALAMYDSEITHLEKMLRILTQKESRPVWQFQTAVYSNRL